MKSDKILRWVYPLEGHCTWESSTFCYGWAPPEHAVLLNGTEVQSRSTSGYFSVGVDLSWGDNQLVLVCDQHQMTRCIHRQAPLCSEAEAHEHGVVFGSSIQSFEGVQGLTALNTSLQPCSIDKTQPIQWADSRVNCFGALHQFDPIVPASWLTESVALPDPLWPHPRRGVLGSPQQGIDGWVCRSAPTDKASRYTPIRTNAVVRVLGVINNPVINHQWFALDCGGQRVGWVYQPTWDTAPRDDSDDVAPQRLRLLETRSVDVHQSAIVFPLRRLTSVQVRVQSNDVTLRVPQCEHHVDVIRFDPSDTVIQSLTCDVVEPNTVEVTAQINRLAGYELNTVGEADEFRIRSEGLLVQTLPKEMKDWRIIIDAGHGGDELGTIAPNGVPEKNLNLKVAVAVEKALNNAGCKNVLMTRRDDVGISLAERTEFVKEHGAHVVLSIHHNALPDGRDPLAHQGLSTYYYHGFSRPLAQHLLVEMASALGVPSYGLFEDTLAITRIHQAMSILMECGFTTHPDDAERLLAPEYPQQFATALVTALASF